MEEADDGGRVNVSCGTGSPGYSLTKDRKMDFVVLLLSWCNCNDY